MAATVQFQLRAVVSGLTQVTNLAGALRGVGVSVSGTTAPMNAIVVSSRAVAGAMGGVQTASQGLKNEVMALRNEFQSGVRTETEFVAENKRLQAGALAAAQGLDRQSKEFRGLTQVAATAQRGIDGATGGVTRLGLASQVHAGILKTGIVGNLTAMIPGAQGATQALGGLTAGGITPMGVAAGVAAAAVLGIGAAVGSSIGKAAEFEAQMSGAQAVLGATQKELGQLSALALQMGKDTSFSAGEAARGIEELGSAGLATKDIIGGGLQGALALAAATGVKDLAFAAGVTATALNSFGLQGKDVAKIADVVAAAANASALKIEDFGTALSAGGSVAKLFKIGLVDFTTALSLMADAGVKGSDAGTSLKAALMNVSKAAPDTTALMEKYGFSIFDSAGKMKSLKDITSNLQTATKGLTDEEKTNFLGRTFGSDGIRAMNILLDAGTVKFNQRKDALNQSGTAEEAARVRLNNLKGAQEALKGSIETLQITVGQFFTPLATNVTQWATAAVNSVLGFITTIKNTGGDIKLLSEKFPLIGAAIKILKPVIDGLGEFFKGAFSAAKSAWDNILYPVVKALEPAFRGAFQGLGTVLETAGKLIGGVLKAIGQLFKGDIVGAAGTLAKTLGDVIGGALKAAGELGSGILGTLVKIPLAMLEIGKNIVLGIVKGIVDNAKAAVNSALKVGSDIVQGLKNLLGIKSPSGVMASQIGLPIIQGIALGITQNAKLVITAVQGVVKGLMATLQPLAGTVAATFSAQMGTLIESMQALDDEDLRRVLKRAQQTGDFASYAAALQVIEQRAIAAAQALEELSGGKAGQLLPDDSRRAGVGIAEIARKEFSAIEQMGKVFPEVLAQALESGRRPSIGIVAVVQKEFSETVDFIRKAAPSAVEAVAEVVRQSSARMGMQLAQGTKEAGRFAAMLDDASQRSERLANKLVETGIAGQSVFDRLSEYAGDAIKGIAGLLESTAPYVNAALQNVVQGIQGVIGSLRKGDWIGAIVSGVSSAVNAIISLFEGAAKSAREARAEFNKISESLTLIDAGIIAQTKTRSRGWFADLFGGPETYLEVNQVALGIAKALESGINGGMKSGIKAFFDGKEGGLLEGLKIGLRDQIISAVTDGFIQSAVLKGALGGLLGQLTMAFTDGTDPSGIIAQIGAALPDLASSLEKVLTPLRDTVNGALGTVATGSTTPAPTDPTVTTPAPRELANLPQIAANIIANPQFVTVMDTAVTRFDGAISRAEAMYMRVEQMYNRLLDTGIRIDVMTQVGSASSNLARDLRGGLA